MKIFSPSTASTEWNLMDGKKLECVEDRKFDEKNMWRWKIFLWGDFHAGKDKKIVFNRISSVFLISS